MFRSRTPTEKNGQPNANATADLVRTYQAARASLPQSPKRKTSKPVMALAIVLNVAFIGTCTYLAWDHYSHLDTKQGAENEGEGAQVLPEDEVVVAPVIDPPAAASEGGEQSFAALERSPIPRMRPEFIEKSLVLPHELADDLGYTADQPYQAQGCGSQRGFDEFWVAGLDSTPFFELFVEDYKSRFQLPDTIGSRSLAPHKRALQIMLGLNECFDSVNRDTYDSTLGPVTTAAVERFQEQNNIPQTGEADAQTMDALIHASAMRTMYNMHVLDLAAQEYDIGTQGVFQKAWHESFYSHMAVSATGADGIGQMINQTFIEESRFVDREFHDEYNAALEEGGARFEQARADLQQRQYDIWMGSISMLSHCDRLLERFNRESCAEVYGAYQLGRGGYTRLIEAAEKTPDLPASEVTRGTESNGYGHYRAEDALEHVNGLIDSEQDRARAQRDIHFLENMREQRAYILGPEVTLLSRGMQGGTFTIDS